MIPAYLAERHHAPTVAWVTGRILRRGDLSYVNARDRAEDAVQEAWAALVKRGLRDGDRMPGLLMRIALRAFFESLRWAEVATRNESLPGAVPSLEVPPGWGAALTAEGEAAALAIECGRCEGCGVPLVNRDRFNAARQRFCNRRCKVRAARARRKAGKK